jgi:osmotically-inducible protein OsmY
MTDHELVYSVKKELLGDARLDAEAIAVSVEAGLIRLSGTVGSFAQEREAQLAAERAAGVEAVDNQLEVQPLSEDAHTDADLRGEVLQLLALHCFVPGTVDARVKGNAVTLTGHVDWQYQRDAAGLVATSAIGVGRVVNSIRLRSKSGASQTSISNNNRRSGSR